MSCLRWSLRTYSCRPLQTRIQTVPWFSTRLPRNEVLSRARKEPQSVLSWLADLKEEGDAGSAQSYLYSRILVQTDALNRAFSNSSSSSSSMGSALSIDPAGSSADGELLLASASSVSLDKASSASSSAIQAAANAVNAALFQQQVALPSSFTVPSHTTVPAYQLVGVFRSMLGHPKLPQAAKATSLEAKWGLLHLTLQHAAGHQQAFEQEVQRLLDDVLLPQAGYRLAKVLSNPNIPAANKQSAEQRYYQLYNNCEALITQWAVATCTTPTFAQLQPAMSAIAPAVAVSLAAGNPMSPSSSASSGKLMEETALQVLRESLPPGWSLLPSLHLLGADGEAFVVVQGCKYEVDMLVLDEQGVAVVIVEVKLAAANPLMSLFNDVNALLRLVDQTAGKTVTAITRSSVDGCTAAASSSAASEVVAAFSTATSAVAKARAATATAPFAAAGKAWHTVHVKVHPNILPLYVLGKGIGEAEVSKGLASLVDSAALKRLANSADEMRQSLMPLEQQHHLEQELQLEQLEQQLSNTSISSADHASVFSTSSQSLDASNSALSEDVVQGMAAGGQLLGRQDSSSSTCSRKFSGISSSRVVVNLSSKQQQHIKEQVQKRVATLKRCMIFSLCAKQVGSETDNVQ